MMLCWTVIKKKKKRGKEILEMVEVGEEDDDNGKRGKESKSYLYMENHRLLKGLLEWVKR